MVNHSPEPEETPTPAVSSLRSKFEKLAVESSSTTSLHRISGNFDLLSPDSGSPRPRSASISDERPPSNPRSLRAAASSSDLKVGGKRPPPPPPPRSSRGNSPTPSVHTSPLLRPQPVDNGPPSPISSTPPVNKAALLQRKPPPPPPPSSAATPSNESSPMPSGSGVASLISKFGNTAPPLHPPRSPHPTPRVVSLTSPGTTAQGPTSLSAHIEGSHRAPRHSFPLSNPPGSPAPLIQLESPFDEGPVEDALPPARPPPPLPTRKSGSIPANAERIADGIRLETLENTESALPGASTESLTTVVSPPPRPSHHTPPPRPPPRPKNTGAPRRIALDNLNSSNTSSPSVTPPPLPARRSTTQTPEDTGVRRAPPPPRHHSTLLSEGAPRTSPPAAEVNAAPLQDSPIDGPAITSPPPIQSSLIIQPTERKAFGSHLPPPTRTIALGDKLPPARRQPSGSSSEEEDDDLKIKVEQLPDSSRASRKPPALNVFPFPEENIWVPSHHGAVAVSGSIVAAAQVQHLKIYDLSELETPIHDLDARALGIETKIKDFKITSIEFRSARKDSDRGAFLWIGTNNGHLLELDTRAGLVVGMKLAAHSHTVTHIFRHGQCMITLDETGKALVFSPDPQGELDVGLAYAQPRVVRVADKQEFVKILGGKLWTSARDSSGAASTSRGPIVRVYDILTPGATGKSLLPTEHLGTVTSGTVLQSQPDRVYLGHEGGNISIWSLNTEDGLPAYEEAVKVSTSDVLSLEGINDRLWAGGRKGTIAAYDVTSKPWIMTNHWKAHKDLPVLKVAADPWSIEKLGKVSVYSFGRDEKVRFWDGLLGVDWIDQELMKREHEFSTFRDLNVLIVSWNLDSARPDNLLDSNPDNFNFLHDVLSSVDSPDVIVFGLQELIDLESRKMAAKTVLLGSKSRNPDALSQRVTTAYKKWYDRLILAVRTAMPVDTPYTIIHTENLVGLFTCIFVKETQRSTLRNTAITTIKRGMGGRYGNKGGIISRFIIDDSSICFINCHLAAGQSHVRQRNADVAAFLEDKQMFPDVGTLEEPVAFVNGGDGSMVLDHEIVFMNGDMNYRIDLRRDAVVADIKSGNLSHLLSQDQLTKEMKLNRGFRLRTFQEGPLTFSPTYKYDRRSDEYDSSEKRRVPAWCDRILWRSREPSRVQQLHYRRWEANVSDHRPISSGFRMTIKSISPANRQLVKQETVAAWAEYEKDLLGAVYQFYASQALV